MTGSSSLGRGEARFESPAIVLPPGDHVSGENYLPAEARARVEIDRQLVACGWLVQNRKEMNLYAGLGVAVREFIMASGHGLSDYLLFIDQKAVGAIEAKPAGSPLVGVESQSARFMSLDADISNVEIATLTHHVGSVSRSVEVHDVLDERHT